MMIFSNVFLVLPVIFAALYGEWLYLFFATGLVIFSPLYHWYRKHSPRSLMYPIFMWCDTAFAVGAFSYMYFYSYFYAPHQYKILLLSALSLIVAFYLYGRRKDYERLHPWFHILAPIISSLILIVTNSYSH
ncbi:MAG: hypothetical protein ACYCZ0_04690 [Minisyncoccota bacterium]